MTNFARSERSALADLFDELGPDAPTLNEGWSTRDLAAHLVVRERRPDAAGGIMIKPLASRTEKVQADYAARPWAELVELVRQGPPAWSPFALGPVDRALNTTEYFVHHEDVRRAQTGWSPRPADPALERVLWSSVTSRGVMLYRKSRVGVVLRRDTGEQLTVKDLHPGVVVLGPASELLLHSFGRTQHARVTIDGDSEAVRVFGTTPLGM